MTLSELNTKFNTQLRCIKHLEKLRWNGKYACPECGSESVKKRPKSIRWHCNACNKDYSVLMGTIFEDTRLPLPKFFQLMLFMINAKMGVSASEISRNIGVKYQTAWLACHKTRCAMVDNEIRLEGMVEFDEAYIGGKKRKSKSKKISTANLSEVTDKRGRGTTKVPVVGAVEKKGQIYLKIIEKLTSKNLLSMLKQTVKEDESIVFTDGFKSYKAFDDKVEHITINHSKTFGKGVKTINTIEGFWSILKNGIKGNYRVVSKKYIPFYLAEFAYKFNQRHLKADAFEVVLLNALSGESCMSNYKPIGDPKKIAARRKKINLEY